jgi:hypothetical protein
MSTLPHLMLQPRSRRSQRRHHRQRVLLAVLRGAALLSTVYLLSYAGAITYYQSTK